MKKYLEKGFLISLILIPFVCTLSCSGKSGAKPEVTARQISVAGEEVTSKIVKMVSPEENSGFKLHEPVKVVMEPTEKDKLPDSLKLFFDGNLMATMKASPWEYTINGNHTITTGRKSLKVTAFREGKQQNTITRFLIFYSDVIPEKYSYKVVNSYPHDREAFTQGLVYDGGRLFEGTGQKAGSSLREVELSTGKVIRQQNLDAALFGEGIAIFGDRIFQVTWEDKVGFVYDKASFNVINKIYYPTEGWGLATIDNKIAMSDGTNIISFYEPETFTAVRKIEVYDNKKKVDKLNELEYINGEIWANIWMTDLIARIDPASGKVLSYIDLKGLLPEKERQADTDVLNGIAFDSQGGRIFVTGKKWPWLYEIKIFK
jgi:glutaminyl-peptide cyclotransferase